VLKKIDQAGDTIVEVLLAMVVVSSVLAGAYASATKSLNSNRQAQERTVAAKVVESQLEQLKGIAGNPAPNIFTEAPPFCVSGPTITSGTCTVTNGIDYTVSIQRSGNDFTARATWDRAGGGPGEQLDMVYRIYP
jgi:type II secretory pathway pseudopilin PulG